MPSAFEIAKYLDLSERQVRRHVNSGMPTDDLENAAAWYRRHVNQSGQTATRESPGDEFLRFMAHTIRDSAFHFMPDQTSYRMIDTMLEDILWSTHTKAKELGLTTLDIQALGLSPYPNIHLCISTADERRQADERAQRRWQHYGHPEKFVSLSAE